MLYVSLSIRIAPDLYTTPLNKTIFFALLPWGSLLFTRAIVDFEISCRGMSGTWYHVLCLWLLDGFGCAMFTPDST